MVQLYASDIYYLHRIWNILRGGVDVDTGAYPDGLRVIPITPIGDSLSEEITDSLRVVSPSFTVATACSGQVTVVTSGTAVQGGNVPLNNGVYVKAHPDNTDSVWVGNDGAGDVSNANGFPLDPGEVILLSVTNLNQLWFDADVNGAKFCWVKG